MLVSFSTMLQKSQLENEAMAKRLNKSQQMASTKVNKVDFGATYLGQSLHLALVPKTVHRFRIFFSLIL